MSTLCALVGSSVPCHQGTQAVNIFVYFSDRFVNKGSAIQLNANYYLMCLMLNSADS